jgi:quinol monooxygenase YgiN
MVVVIMEMRARPEKCMELKQTLQALIKPTINEKGCLGYEIFENIENENSFCLVERWDTQKDLTNHQQSDRFAVLMGTRSLLSEEPKLWLPDAGSLPNPV